MDLQDTTGREQLLVHLHQLYLDLHAVIERDPEQEVLGVALPVLDGIISAARQHVTVAASGIGITAAMVDLISLRTVEDGTPVRALDTWLVVGQLLASLGVTVAPPTTFQPSGAGMRAPMFTT